MKQVRAISVVFLLSLFAAVARANTIDPSGGLVGGGSIQNIFSTSFTLTFTTCPTVTTSTGTSTMLAETCFAGINRVTDATGSPVNWTNVQAMITFNVLMGTTSPLPVGCFTAPSFSSTTYSQVFSTCSVLSMTLDSTMTKETATILWFGGTITSTPLLGDPPSSNFTVGTMGMSNATGNAIANVPEPGTLALFLTGIGALLTRRRPRGEVCS